MDRDEDGLEFPDLDTAYLEAFQAATEMWIEALAEVRNPSRERFEIRDGTGRIVLVLPFSEIIETGRGVRRRVRDCPGLLSAVERTRDLQTDVATQIAVARKQIREARESLARIDKAVRGPD